MTQESTTSRKDAEFSAYLQGRQATLLRTAYLLTGDAQTAEDVVQTAFAKLYLSWGRAAEGSLDAYVRRIVVNEAHSVWRRPWRRREVSAAVLPEHGQSQEYDDGRAAEVWQAVSRLPKRQRAVIVLRYYEDLSEAEIAEVLEISPGTVKSQASRALATLRHAGFLREDS